MKQQGILKKMEEVVRDTVFFAKNLDDFDRFYLPGINYNIIASRGSEYAYTKWRGVYVHEYATRKRVPSTSQFFREELLEMKVPITQNSSIWTYQAYPWTDDFRLICKDVFAPPFWLYVSLQNKLRQESLILEGAVQTNDRLFRRLKKHFLEKQQITGRTFLQSSIDLTHPFNREDKMVVSASYSDGGNGVYLVDSMSSMIRAMRNIGCPVVRIEKYIENSIPLNQIGVVLSDDCIARYTPSEQLIRISDNGTIEYKGSDFSRATEKLNSETLSTVDKLTTDVGKAIAKLGYRGVFGCDYLACQNGRVVFIEINPRYQASCLIPNINNLDLHKRPHFLHILSFINCGHDHAAMLDKLYSFKKPIRVVNKDDYCAYQYWEPGIQKGEDRRPSALVDIEEGAPKGFVLYKTPPAKL